MSLAAKTIISAQPGPQTAFLQTAADICIYGGAAGGGKTLLSTSAISGVSAA